MREQWTKIKCENLSEGVGVFGKGFTDDKCQVCKVKN